MTEALIQKALAIFAEFEHGGRFSEVDAIEELWSRQPFEDMTDAEVQPIIDAALSRRRPTRAPLQAAQGPRGAGGRQPPQAGSSRNLDESLCTAPYRFVTIDDQVVAADGLSEEANYDFPLPGGFSGTLTVTWAVETPMAIGETPQNSDAAATPFKLGDTFAIPGATLRGMLRASMGIVARARLSQINGNHRYGVRDFTHPLFASAAGDRTPRFAWSEVKAGWLQKKPLADGDPARQGSDYTLTPCDKKIIRIRALPASFNEGRSTANGDWHRAWLQLKIPQRYEKAGYHRNRLFDFEQSAKTSFVPDPRAPANDPTAADYVVTGNGGRMGWFVFSANSPSLQGVTAATLDDQEQNPKAGNQKKREYAFFDRPNAQPIRLPQEAFDRFLLINSKPGKTKPKPDGSFAVLAPTLDAGHRIPVFYVGDPINDPDHFDMGLTRLFKVAHRYSVEDVRNRQPAHQLDADHRDLVETLFGYVYDRVDLAAEPDASLDPGLVARKGRVAFGFAKLMAETPAHPSATLETVAMAPRASFAPFYLKGPIKDWTDQATNGAEGAARLAGRKRYFPRFQQTEARAAYPQIEQKLRENRGNGNRDTLSSFELLQTDRTGGELWFKGEIDLHNLLPEEIGALLWTITHGGDPGKPYRHMIGRAKFAGAGQTRVKAIKLDLEAHPGPGGKAAMLTEPEAWEMPGAEGGEGWLPAGGHSMGPFLRAFETRMRAAAPNWPESAEDVKEFLSLSDPTLTAGLPANSPPELRDFGKLRGAVKADVRHDPPRTTPARLLTTPIKETAAIKLPYRLGA
jgi:hypothetical protein